jgi:hypothetical protein
LASAQDIQDILCAFIFSVRFSIYKGEESALEVVAQLLRIALISVRDNNGAEIVVLSQLVLLEGQRLRDGLQVAFLQIFNQEHVHLGDLLALNLSDHSIVLLLSPLLDALEN